MNIKPINYFVKIPVQHRLHLDPSLVKQPPRHPIIYHHNSMRWDKEERTCSWQLMFQTLDFCVIQTTGDHWHPIRNHYQCYPDNRWPLRPWISVLSRQQVTTDVQLETSISVSRVYLITFCCCTPPPHSSQTHNVWLTRFQHLIPFCWVRIALPQFNSIFCPEESYLWIHTAVESYKFVDTYSSKVLFVYTYSSRVLFVDTYISVDLSIVIFLDTSSICVDLGSQ